MAVDTWVQKFQMDTASAESTGTMITLLSLQSSILMGKVRSCLFYRFYMGGVVWQVGFLSFVGVC
jgi:hypothetical protein